MFFSFDGVDGAGKTTQMSLFCDWLRELGHDVLTCRDPGSTVLGETLRRIVLEPSDLAIDARSEMLLYMAARAQLVAEVIRPALAQGKTVVSDRFLLANVVYQGHAGGLDVDDVWRVGEVATGHLRPELNIVLDLSVEEAAARMTRALDRMEARGPLFQQKVRNGFLAEAERFPEQIAVINAAATVEQVQAAIRAAAKRVLPHALA